MPGAGGLSLDVSADNRLKVHTIIDRIIDNYRAFLFKQINQANST